MNTLLGVIAGITWVINKVIAIRKDSKATTAAQTAAAAARAAAATAEKVGHALEAASSIMLQLVLTARPTETAESMIVACKGVVAIQLAKVGIYEADRAPFDPLIDKAIAAAVTKWVELHPSPSRVQLPITRKL